MARRKNSDPMDYLVTGAVLAAAGGLVLAVGISSDAALVVVAGSVVAALGGMVAWIGVVAMGVLVGLRARASEEAIPDRFRDPRLP